MIITTIIEKVKKEDNLRSNHMVQILDFFAISQAAVF